MNEWQEYKQVNQWGKKSQPRKEAKLTVNVKHAAVLATDKPFLVN